MYSIIFLFIIRGKTITIDEIKFPNEKSNSINSFTIFVFLNKQNMNY